MVSVGRGPFIDIPGADELIGELEAYLAIHYPLLDAVPAARQVHLQAILVPIVRGWAELGTGVGGMTITGPFQDRPATGTHTLLPHEAAALSALCGLGVGVVLSLGSFPPPEPITDMFVRRPGWPPIGCY